MGTVFRKTFTKRLPDGAEQFVRKGQNFARWKDSKGRTRTAPLTDGRDGTLRIVETAGTYTAKYRTGGGIVREVSTGCRDERAARSVLAELERRAELVKAGVISAAEDRVAEHSQTRLADHFTAYLDHMEASGASVIHIADTKRLGERVFKELGFVRLADLNPEAMEQWLNERKRAKMAARTRNSYLQAVRGFLNWCVERNRLVVNPLAGVQRSSEKDDRRRTRRAMTEDELGRLLYVAHRRPLAEYGRVTARKPRVEAKGRKTWALKPLSFADLDDAVERARDRLRSNPALVEAQERLGWERALIYRTMILTGLRQGEIASLTVGQVQLSGPHPYIELRAGDEKNREGSQIALRSDLAADLDRWVRSMRERVSDAATLAIACQRSTAAKLVDLPSDARLFSVPEKMVKILDRDLAVADIPKKDSRGRTVDMHALRHSFGSHLSKAGVAPRTAQAAMRHKKIDLTMNVYTDPKLLDIHGALESLPDFALEGRSPAESHRQKATGTEGQLQLAPPLAPNLVQAGQAMSFPDRTAPSGPEGSDSLRLVRSGVSVKRKDPLSIADSGSRRRGRRDLNPQPPDRQSGTLTN